MQGFWVVGSSAARTMFDVGARVIAISDVEGAIVNTKGIDVPPLQKIVSDGGSVSEYKDFDCLDNESLLALDCDVLMPAAIEDVITPQNAADIRERLTV